RKAYEIRVAESENRFRDVVEASGEYIWECDQDMRYTYLSERFETVMGIAPSLAIGKKITDFVCGHEVKRLEVFFADMSQRNTGFTNVTVESESEVLGQVWQRWNAVPVRNDDHECIGFRGAGLDITFQRAAEDGLFQANEKIRGILESIHDCFISVNHDLEFTYVNHAAENELGQPGIALIGCPIWDALPEELHEALKQEFEAAQEVEGAHVFEVFLSSAGRWFEYRVSRGREGYSVFFHDITQAKESHQLIDEQMLQINEANFLLEVQQMELQEANSQLSRMAETDGLTGLYNRNKLNEVLEESVGAAEAGEGSMSMVIMDVDNFKKYNDSFGHLAGDDVLKTVAQIIRDTVGLRGVPARYGGEEFVVVVPGGTTEMAAQMAEEIRVAIQDHLWELRPVTASLGVSTWYPGASTEHVIEAADEAMYLSKQSGRNQVSIAGGNAEAA
ncbi:MAG: diguanylate cyclase, partial [Armatimonadota bacterium]